MLKNSIRFAFVAGFMCAASCRARGVGLVVVHCNWAAVGGFDYDGVAVECFLSSPAPNRM